MPLSNYVVALVLSILIEVSVAYLMGYRESKYLVTIAMINCITNPILNYFILILAFVKFYPNYLFIGLLEAIVILAEWGLLVHVFHKPRDKLLMLALATNAVSFVVGILIFWI